MRLYQFLPLIIILFCSSGCEYPQASVTKAEWIGYSREKEEISSQLFMEVENPNFFSLPIKGVAYHFELFGKPLVSGKVGLEKDIPAHGKTNFTVPLNMGIKDSMNVGLELLKNKEWPWKVGGAVLVAAPLVGEIEVPYDKAGTWQRPAMFDGVGSAVGAGLDMLKGMFGGGNDKEAVKAIKAAPQPSEGNTAPLAE